MAFSIKELTYLFHQNNILSTVQHRWQQVTLDTTGRLLSYEASNMEHSSVMVAQDFRLQSRGQYWKKARL